MAALGDLARRFDPAGIMHPGVLLPDAPASAGDGISAGAEVPGG